MDITSRDLNTYTCVSVHHEKVYGTVTPDNPRVMIVNIPRSRATCISSCLNFPVEGFNSASEARNFYQSIELVTNGDMCIDITKYATGVYPKELIPVGFAAYSELKLRITTTQDITQYNDSVVFEIHTLEQNSAMMNLFNKKISCLDNQICFRGDILGVRV